MEETNEDTQEVTQAGGDEEIRDPKAVLEALARAKEDAKRFREQFEALEAEKAEWAERIAALEGDEGIALWKGKAVELAAKQQLAKSGVKDIERIYGFLDASNFDYDDEGRVTGLDEALADVKKKLPELFDDKKRVANGADAFANEPVKQNITGTEAQVKRIFKH
jgi:hypothetical protein